MSRTLIFRVTEDRQKYSPLKLRQNFFMPEHVYNDRYPKGLEPVIRGLTQQHSFAVDNNMAEDVKNHLFEDPSQPFGLDLAATNIMRGRDHGIPGYNEWREFCGFKRFTTFEAMEDEMFPGSAANMAKIYKHPDDIDFFVGGLNEIPMGGDSGVAPPTMACVIGIQFHNFRYGDRFWYENYPKPGIIDYPFKPDQLQEIRKISLSKLACLNSDTVKYIQKNMFLQPGLYNPILACKDIPAINLEYWKDS